MKCPKCGGELQRSKKDPSYGLCYTCRKKFRWVEDIDEDDFEVDDAENESTYNHGKMSPTGTKKRKKKPGCLKAFAIVFACIVVITAIASLAGGGDTQNSDKKADTQQDSNAETEALPGEEQSTESAEPDVPAEYKNALIKAEQYSDTMYMSKQGIYDQLTSEYGEQFSEEAAQYAVDNLQADYKKNALEKAKQYQEQMAMSSDAIRDQLVSENGEKFTEEEADYAISNLPQ